jgi:cytochrome c-type biogenesis protein CcmH
MLTFVLLAIGLVLIAVAAVAVPLLRRRGNGVGPAPAAALTASALLIGGSSVLYLLLSNWSWHAAPPADSPQAMVARLARQLEQSPDNLDGWLMLGRSYAVLREYPLAVRAFERADRLSGGKNATALIGEATALILEDPQNLEGIAPKLIEQALQLEPRNGQALFFSAEVALRRGDLALARERFNRIIALNPPQDVRTLIEQQIAAIDQRLTAGPAAATPAAPGSEANAASATVRVNVTLSPALTASAGEAPLFVFVRDPHMSGPPLAVKRLSSHFPQSVALSASDSMLPGRALVSGQSVQVIARIARSGNPVGASGDPVGEVTYHVGSDGLVNLVIDRLTP